MYTLIVVSQARLSFRNLKIIELFSPNSPVRGMLSPGLPLSLSLTFSIFFFFWPHLASLCMMKGLYSCLWTPCPAYPCRISTTYPTKRCSTEFTEHIPLTTQTPYPLGGDVTKGKLEQNPSKHGSWGLIC